jgi:hypothetical protein
MKLVDIKKVETEDKTTIKGEISMIAILGAVAVALLVWLGVKK